MDKPLLQQECAVGMRLPALTKPPISRATLALFAGASNDHNPIHIDSDFAKSFGMQDVFAHGMLVMAYLGHALTSWAGQAAIRRFETKFAAITQLGAEITCSGEVVEVYEQAGERQAKLTLSAADQHGDIKLQAEAVVALT